jgi:hypothetical protein
MSGAVDDSSDVANGVATDVGQLIRDALFEEWDFPMQRLRCAYEEESSDPDGGSDLIEMIDEDGDRWRIDLAITATHTGNINDASSEDDDVAEDVAS